MMYEPRQNAIVDCHIDKLEAFVEFFVDSTDGFTESEKSSLLEALQSGNLSGLSDRCREVLDEFRDQLRRSD